MAAAGACTVALAVALGLAAIQVLPSSLYARHSLRWVGDMAFPSTAKVPYMYQIQSALSPVAIVGVLFPVIDGMGSGEVWTPYAGVLPFLFAALAVARRWANPWVRFLMGLAIAAFLYTLAGISALHGVLYVVAPFLWMAREATRFVYLTGFCLSVLAAYGLDYFCAAARQEQLWTLLKRGLSLGIAGCLALFLLPVFFPKAGGPWQYFSLLVILMSCVLMRFSLGANSLRLSPLFRILVIGLLFFDLNAFHWLEINKLEADHSGQDEQEVLNSLKGAVDYLKRQSPPFRVKVFHDPEPNIGDAYGVRSLAGGGVTLDEYAVNVLRDADLMNVQYFVKPASVTDAGAIFQDEHWKVYRNAAAFPHAWIVHSSERVQNEAEMIERLKRRHSELRQIAFVAHAPNMSLSAPGPGSRESAHLDFASTNQIRVTVNAASPGLLVMGEIYYPEWHATINGQEARILRADEALRAVAVPAGQSVLEFRYRPDSVYIGACLSILTAISVALLFWLSRVRQGDSPTPNGLHQTDYTNRITPTG